MPRFGSVSLPFLGLVTASRWSTNQGFGIDIDQQTGTTVWLGRWEVNADTPAAFALPVLAPVAILRAFLPAPLGKRGVTMAGISKALRPLALLATIAVVPIHATAQSLELVASVSERQRQQDREIAKLKDEISSLRHDRDTLSSTLMNTWDVVRTLEGDIKKLKQRDNTIDLRVYELEKKARQ